MSFLADVEKFKKDRLRPATTVFTQTDGKKVCIWTIIWDYVASQSKINSFLLLKQVFFSWEDKHFFSVCRK